MQDDRPSSTDFKARVRDYEQARDAGRGVYSAAAPKRRRRIWRNRFVGAALILLILAVLKSGVYFFAGPIIYNNKLAQFTNSQAFTDRAVVAVLRPDPVSMTLVGFYSAIEFRAQALFRIYKLDRYIQ